MEKWSNSVAVVTGANFGIGFATYKKLAESSLTVVGLDISVDALEKYNNEIGNGRLYAIICDVTKNELTEATFKWIEDNLGGVDILINNAGIYRNIGILEHEKSMCEVAMMIDVNFTAVIRCARLAFKSMQKRDTFGYIVNMNSISGHSVPVPESDQTSFGAYAGTKYAMTATTEVIRQELNLMKNRKVRVTSISAGLVNTNLLKAAKVESKIENMILANSLKAEDISDTVYYLLSLPYAININDIILRATGGF